MKFGDSLFRIAWSKLQFPLHTQTTKSVTNILYGGQKQVKQNLPFGNISSNDYSHKRNKLNGPTPEKGVRKYGTFPCHLGSFSCRENFSWAPDSDHLPIPNGKRIRRKLCAFFFFKDVGSSRPARLGEAALSTEQREGWDAGKSERIYRPARLSPLEREQTHQHSLLQEQTSVVQGSFIPRPSPVAVS